MHDARRWDRLIRDDDAAVYGDKGYASGTRKRAAEAAGVLWAVKEKAMPGHKPTVRQRARNRRFGKVRARSSMRPRSRRRSSAIARYAIAASSRMPRRCPPLALANLYLARRTLLRLHEDERGQRAPCVTVAEVTLLK